MTILSLAECTCLETEKYWKPCADHYFTLCFGSDEEAVLMLALIKTGRKKK